jgi:hypothetical protein
VTQRTDNIAVQDGRLTELGKRLCDEIAARVTTEALKTADPHAYISMWDARFRVLMSELPAGGTE